MSSEPLQALSSFRDPGVLSPHALAESILQAWSVADPVRLTILVQSAPAFVVSSLIPRIRMVLMAEASAKEDAFRNAHFFSSDPDELSRDLGFPLEELSDDVTAIIEDAARPFPDETDPTDASGNFCS